SQPKGMKAFLEERGLWRDELLANCEKCKKNEQDFDITNCCTRRLVANQPDFLAERGLIQKEIENCGHK
ncbi:9589_t:CDS:1, partial [Gigaspora rosea]